MGFADPPASAAFVHIDTRTGFEVVTFRPVAGGWHVDGCTTAVEDGLAWAVDYHIEVDEGWTTRSALIGSVTAAGRRSVALHADGTGGWLVDGLPEPGLDGCLDVDLESSAVTNLLPVRRLDLAVGAGADTPAVYVRAADLSVERIDQRYDRADEHGYDYASATFDVRARLRTDRSGLVLDYPGLARRLAGKL
jgi:hypothetical protein